MDLHVTIKGMPIAKARPKFFIVPMAKSEIYKLIQEWSMKDATLSKIILVKMALRKAGRYIRAYGEQKQQEQEFIDQLMPQLNGHKKFEGPVEIIIWFGMPRPKSHYGTGRNSGIIKASAPEFPIVKPDKDNLEKFVYDLFNDRVWMDDRQVVKSICSKEYTENPRTEIIIREVFKSSAIS